MPGLYPTFTQTVDEQDERIMCRPNPVSGCIKLIKYDRYTSNRLRDYGPFDRFIDRARLISGQTMDDILGPDRYAVAHKVSIMGSALQDRPAFLDLIYPFKGMSCPG